MIQNETIDRIVAERARQANLPGIEYDITNTPNDWTAIVSHYLSADVRRGPVKPLRTHYEDNLIKAAAVILAALEHCDKMDAKNYFLKSEK